MHALCLFQSISLVIWCTKATNPFDDVFPLLILTCYTLLYVIGLLH